jgi:hypothetical protein
VRPAVSEPYLLLCEGLQDKVFFEALFKANGLGGFLIECPEKGEEGAGGITQYPAYFSGLIARTRPNLKGLIITADCDDSATNRFTEIAQWLSESGYNPPSIALSVTPGQAAPYDLALMILLIPPNSATGCLETLLYPAAANKWPAMMRCVNDYWKCLGLSGTTMNQESKIKLRALLAGAYPKNPNLTLSRIWDDQATELPLGDASFAPLIDAIKDFCANV